MHGFAIVQFISCEHLFIEDFLVLITTKQLFHISSTRAW